MLRVVITFIFLFCSITVMADVQMWQLSKTDNDAQPVGVYDEAHIVSECDSQRTKRRAHALSSSNWNKTKDVEMINGNCLNVCNSIALTDASQAVSCVRECNDREREQRQQGWSAGQGLLGLLGIGAALLK